MLVCKLGVAAIYLVNTVLTMEQSEAFGRMTVKIHLMHIVNKMRCLAFFALNLVLLDNLVRVLVLGHRIEKGFFAYRQVILVFFILVAVLGLA